RRSGSTAVVTSMVARPPGTPIPAPGVGDNRVTASRPVPTDGVSGTRTAAPSRPASVASRGAGPGLVRHPRRTDSAMATRPGSAGADSCRPVASTGDAGGRPAPSSPPGATSDPTGCLAAVPDPRAAG